MLSRLRAWISRCWALARATCAASRSLRMPRPCVDQVGDVAGLGRQADDVALGHGDAPTRPQHVDVGAGDVELQVQRRG